VIKARFDKRAKSGLEPSLGGRCRVTQLRAALRIPRREGAAEAAAVDAGRQSRGINFPGAAEIRSGSRNTFLLEHYAQLLPPSRRRFLRWRRAGKMSGNDAAWRKLIAGRAKFIGRSLCANFGAEFESINSGRARLHRHDEYYRCRRPLTLPSSRNLGVESRFSKAGALHEAGFPASLKRTVLRGDPLASRSRNPTQKLRRATLASTKNLVRTAFTGGKSAPMDTGVPPTLHTPWNKPACSHRPLVPRGKAEGGVAG